MNLGGSGAFRWYFGVKVRAGKVVCFSSFLLLGWGCLVVSGSVLSGVVWCPLFEAGFVVAVSEGRCGWGGWLGGWARAGKGVLNVHRMKKRSCYARGRCMGYPVIFH